jgi:hypothetical protein
MGYEARLALKALGEASARDREASGLPFMIDENATDAGSIGPSP